MRRREGGGGKRSFQVGPGSGSELPTQSWSVRVHDAAPGRGKSLAQEGEPGEYVKKVFPRAPACRSGHADPDFTAPW